MKYLLFAASLCQNSINKKLINLVAKMLEQQDTQVDLADFAEFDMPLFNGDLQAQGLPATVTQFVERMHATDALVIASPEYNFSIPGTLKNLIDWVSRVQPNAWDGQKILLLSASPSLVGGNRGLWATRVPLEACGSFVFPNMFSLASAHEAFNPNGSLKDPAIQQRLVQLLQQFTTFVGRKN